MEGAHRDQERGRSRIVVCVTRCARKGKELRDIANLSAKYLVDRVVDSKLISGDDKKTINEILDEQPAQTPEEVGTVITILWP